MRVSYNKLWKLLVDKKMSKADLRKAVDIAPNTLTKMRKDGEVSMSVLLKIATYLDCDISDICEFVKDASSYDRGARPLDTSWMDIVRRIFER